LVAAALGAVDATGDDGAAAFAAVTAVAAGAANFAGALPVAGAAAVVVAAAGAGFAAVELPATAAARTGAGVSAGGGVWYRFIRVANEAVCAAAAFEDDGAALGLFTTTAFADGKMKMFFFAFPGVEEAAAGGGPLAEAAAAAAAAVVGDVAVAAMAADDDVKVPVFFDPRVTGASGGEETGAVFGGTKPAGMAST